MTTLMNFLANITGRKVVDETGLTGNFDFHLEWVPDEAMPVPVGPAGPADDSARPTASDIKGVSFFTALQDQLGLKLQSTKGPAEVIVIDHVEKPDAN
jgi:bla regulator protein blaR1